MPRTRLALLAWVVLAAFGPWLLLLQAGPEITNYANGASVLAMLLLFHESSQDDADLLIA
jgi:hypothetical protein